jgi:NhaA family Na+:H+ antiporter
LAFGHGTSEGDHVKIGVLVGSVIAGMLAAVLLLSRNAVYRRIAEAETADADHDGVPDIYQAQQD